MPLKKMIAADKICADQLFLRESASRFSSPVAPLVVWRTDLELAGLTSPGAGRKMLAQRFDGWQR